MSVITTFPYNFIINGNTIISNIQYILHISNMSSFASKNISGSYSIQTIPNEYSANILDTSTASDWSSAFSGCMFLTSAPNPFYNMSNATDISAMFRECQSLSDVSSVKFGNKVTNMQYTFSNCLSIT